MKIWLPYIRGGSGTDIFTRNLEEGLRRARHEAIATELPHFCQLAPWMSRRKPQWTDTDAIIANSWNGFAFRQPGVALVVVVHLCVHDPAYKHYSTISQRLFHSVLVRRYELLSFWAADAVVAVSEQTASAVRSVFPGVRPIVISNGVDIGFFSPPSEPMEPIENRRIRLLFVGNLSKRKGADLLPRILRELGDSYELRFTSGLRNHNSISTNHQMIPLGRLNREEIRQAYREADLLLAPSRLEGLSLTGLEAMACGLPIIAGDTPSFREIVEDGATGRLCSLEQPTSFVSAIREITNNPETLIQMRKSARERAVSQFSIDELVRRYEMLLFDVTRRARGKVRFSDLGDSSRRFE